MGGRGDCSAASGAHQKKKKKKGGRNVFQVLNLGEAVLRTKSPVVSSYLGPLCNCKRLGGKLSMKGKGVSKALRETET